MAETPAGWFHDPYGRYQERYWDGKDWTGHVLTDGQQSVDPLGNSSVIPIVSPATAYEFGPVEQVPAERLPFLSALGPDARTRPRPSLRHAVAGLGGSVLAIGALIATIGDSPSRGKIVGVAAVLVVAAWVLRSFVKVEEVQAAAVGMVVVGIVVFGAGVSVDNDRADFLTGIVIAALFIGAWAAPGFRGRNLLLGLGAIALVAAVGSLADGNSSQVDKCNSYIDAGEFDRFDAECQNVFNDSSAANFLPTSFTNSVGDQGVIYLVGAALLLGATWWFDRKGLQGVATALVTAGLVSAVVGTALLVDRLDETTGPIFVSLVGLGVCVVGSHGGRRATTWWGAVLLAGGLVALVAVQMKPGSSGAAGAVAIVSGLGLVVLAAVGAAVQRATTPVVDTAVSAPSSELPPPSAE
jgi:uncharacterized membrane protein YwzB